MGKIAKNIVNTLVASAVSLGSAVALAAAPIANPDTATTKNGVAVSIPVMANDRDPDGDTFTIGSFPKASRPKNGSVSRQGRFAVYTPKAGFSGTDSFSYRLKDSTNTWSRATKVTVTVAAISNTAPVATADNTSTVSPEAIVINLLGNDTDPDGDTLTVSGTTVPGNGTVTLSGGSATYTPAAGFSGTDTFGYFLDDGRGGTAIGTVTVSVSAPALPEAANASAVLSWNAPTTRADGSPLTMADIEGYEIYVLSESTGETATITLDDGAASSYTLDNLPADTYHFSMAAKDTQGNLSALSAVVSKTITP